MSPAGFPVGGSLASAPISAEFGGFPRRQAGHSNCFFTGLQEKSMSSRSLAGLLVAGCLTAAAGGAYVAVRQNAASPPAVAAPAATAPVRRLPSPSRKPRPSLAACPPLPHRRIRHRPRPAPPASPAPAAAPAPGPPWSRRASGTVARSAPAPDVRPARRPASVSDRQSRRRRPPTRQRRFRLPGPRRG